ncbi:MAG TPA: hypothetical protein VFU47_05165, partial [Armatimonadota bacterium]|nr:hypothetical protein [Armatimonadota bacterium]
PEYGAGQNDGPAVHQRRTAFDVKKAHRCLSSFRDDELKQIPILNEGERLEQGAVYFDLRHPQDGEIRARGDMVAGPDHWYIPKSDVDYQLWNLLIGVDNWDRLGTLVDEGEEHTAAR